MSALIKLAVFFIWAGFVPAAMGILPSMLLKREKRTPALVVIMGFLFSFTVFELLGAAVMMTTYDADFNLLVKIYSAVSIFWILAGITMLVAETVRAGKGTANPTAAAQPVGSRHLLLKGGISPLWAVFAVILLLQLYMLYTRMSFDGDDAYYVAQSVQAWQKGTMYKNNAYTGVPAPTDWRHALALIPMWIAAVSSICGTHPAIVTHSMIPLIFLPLTDIAFYELAARLFKDDGNRKNRLPAFMCVLAVLQLFGNTSIYTPETFLMMRTWQGKSVFVNFLVPAAVTTLLMMAGTFADEKTPRREKAFLWLRIILINTASCFCTMLAPVLTAVLLMTGSIFIAIYCAGKIKKPLRVFLGMFLCCLPNAIFMVILFALIHPEYIWYYLQGGRGM